MVQWLRFHPSNAGGTGSIPGRGTKAPHDAQPKKKNCVQTKGQFLRVGAQRASEGPYYLGRVLKGEQASRKRQGWEGTQGEGTSKAGG